MPSDEPKRRKVEEGGATIDNSKAITQVEEVKLRQEEEEEVEEISSPEYDSEEERQREQEWLRKEVVEHLRKKQEPLTMQ